MSIVKRRRISLYLPLLMVLVGVSLVGHAYLQAYRQAQLDRALVTAVKNVNFPAVQSLLRRGANANTHDSAEPDLSFTHFVKRLLTRWQSDPSPVKASPSVLQVVIESAGPSGYYDPDKRFLGADSIGEALITSGADTHFSMEFWGTPLHSAASAGMHKTLQSLLLRGVDLKAKEEALVGADTESTQMLIRYGASPNANGPAPLIYAVERVDVATAQVLLSAGANPNCKNQEGYTPLMFAGEPEIAKLLIQSGANVNAKDKDGFSVLAHADGNYKRFDQEEHKGLMALLKQYGAKE